jgi:HK97 family phage major capsid protein
MPPEIAELIAEVKKTREDIGTAEAARQQTIEELKKAVGASSATVTDVEAKLVRIATDIAGNTTKLQSLEETINTLSKKINRPGSEANTDEQNRKHAIGLLQLRHEFKVTKKDVEHPFQPTEEQINEAMVAVKALHALVNTSDVASLSPEFRKALTAFNMGASGFILAPEMSSRILSCIVDPTDVTGLFDNLTISGPSVKFLVDNVRIDQAAWACETTCFANNPQAFLNEGLGELEIKPETLRYIICASRDILEDASVDIEAWMIRKVNYAFRNTISTAAISGTGSGMPVGILNPAAGIPICDTSANTPAGQFTWQDLIMLKWQVPMQWHGGGKYLMNQNTFGLTLTMSDALGRPLMIATPQDNGSYIINGSGVQVVTQMPDVAPGATPVAWGNWKAVYMIVNRKSVTMQQDPYSAGFCILFKFESRIGGGVICPLAARLMRIQ